MMRRIPGAAIGVFALLTLTACIFGLGRCAGNATSRSQWPESAKGWAVAAVLLAAVLLARWAWRAVRRLFRRH